MTTHLYQYLADNLNSVPDAVPQAFVQQLKQQYGDSLYAIVFYGSCLRSREYDDAMLDFYVIVRDYKSAYRSIWPRIANRLLAPNVYCLNVRHQGKDYLAKYAVISQRGLEVAVSKHAFHSYFWARFCQPIGYVFVVDAQAKDFLARTQASAITTFVNKVGPMTSLTMSPYMFWIRGFELTYAAELRAERKSRAHTIVEYNRDFYQHISMSTSIPAIAQSQPLAGQVWQLRIIVGKLLSILRLLKAATTFTNGVDYIAWKIHRHTGQQLEVTPRLRKYPWLFAWPILFKLMLKRTIK